MKLILLFILICICTFCTSSHGAERVVTRFYGDVQVLDDDFETWRSLHALARITCRNDSLSVNIWYHWASESINPLVRIRLSSRAQNDVGTGRWHYTGTLFRSAGVGTKCRVESCNEIADGQNQELIIILGDYSVQYKISRKAPRNNEY